MLKIIKLPTLWVFKKLNLYSLHCLKKSGFLYEIGWFKSFREGRSIDGAGNPIPWITYPTISFLEKRIKKHMTVFEYGCGYSTLWWASRVRHVISCEHDRQWYEKMRNAMPPNVELYYADLDLGNSYIKKIAEYQSKFDIVVLDGRDRVRCAKNALFALKENGVILWDNSDRNSYEEGFDYLFEKGFKKIDFEGMGPVNTYSWCTSVFYKDKNCLEI
ncbi:MAG: class I SAM-dependent methyltransferase [Candidatus Brocadia sp.]|nr:class I SAM-dependent methyltransferase [Candidatus Brocadia sp.]MDG6027625.1 class I SAM-dependent methyltransferase [Candidatus Brocadia sp.]